MNYPGRKNAYPRISGQTSFFMALWVLTPPCFYRGIDSFQARKRTLSIILTTTGEAVEPVERAVEIIRGKYRYVNFVIPDYAMSAGTIFCMSGDKIYMSKSSSLGPIDPQVPKSDGKYVPAMGYLEQFEKLVEKSRQGAREHRMRSRWPCACCRRTWRVQGYSCAVRCSWMPCRSS